MTAKVQKLLPSFNNLIKEVIKLSNNILSTRSQNPKTSSQIFNSLSYPHFVLPIHRHLALAALPLQFTPQLIQCHL